MSKPVLPPRLTPKQLAETRASLVPYSVIAERAKQRAKATR